VGTACLIKTRIRASISPRQSLSSLILASISWDGESPLPATLATLVALFPVLVAFLFLLSWALSVPPVIGDGH
jgi:hypothetical protein